MLALLYPGVPPWTEQNSLQWQISVSFVKFFLLQIAYVLSTVYEVLMFTG